MTGQVDWAALSAWNKAQAEKYIENARKAWESGDNIHMRRMLREAAARLNCSAAQLEQALANPPGQVIDDTSHELPGEASGGSMKKKIEVHDPDGCDLIRPDGYPCLRKDQHKHKQADFDKVSDLDSGAGGGQMPPPAEPYQPRRRSTDTPGGSMSITEVRTGIGLACDKASESLGAYQKAQSDLEQAQGLLMRAVEGSGQNDQQEALALLAQAISSTTEVQQGVSAAIQAAEGVANRL